MPHCGCGEDVFLVSNQQSIAPCSDGRKTKILVDQIIQPGFSTLLFDRKNSIVTSEGEDYNF